MKKTPRVLLIGAGQFGKNHLRVLRKLERRGLLRLFGVVVRSHSHARRIAKETGLPTFTKITPKILGNVDAVDIVTPSQTHFQLVKQALNYGDVFVEKPLTEESRTAWELAKIAKRKNRVLMVGHIFRHYPIAEKLKVIVKSEGYPEKISGEFIGPLEKWRGENPIFEEIHWFDILDFLLGVLPDSVFAKPEGPVTTISLRYKNRSDAEIKIGWVKSIKERTLTLFFKNKTVRADFKTCEIRIQEGGKLRKIKYPMPIEPLEKELRLFVKSISDRKTKYVSGGVGARIVEVAERAERSAESKKKSVAVIGGGIFGTTAALFLAKRLNVTLFERNPDILGEASLANQYRHHMGYHYPRSPETIQEVQSAGQDFKKFYGQSVVSGFPSYYCVAKNNSRLTGKQFLEVCRKMNLPFTKAYPDRELLDRTDIETCVKTPEAVFDYEKLKAIIKERLSENNKISIQLGAEVQSVNLNGDGSKTITARKAGRNYSQAFDYVINATYANYNRFCDWLGFPKRDLELRFKEVIIVKLSLKRRAAATVVDGPFATIVPIGETDYYTFGDVPLSVRDVVSGEHGTKPFEKRWRNAKTLWKEMQKRCLKWFPILKYGEYAGSLFVVLPIERQSRSTDARPTEVTGHGFGCYSILSGKVITCVSAAKEILGELE